MSSIKFNLNIVLFVSNLRLLHCYMESKIVGGDYAKNEEYPHAVFFYMECNNKVWGCGASVVNQDILLTAAHCGYKCDGHYEFYVYGGDIDHEQGNPYVRKIQKIIRHENYYERTVENDIALVLIETKLPLNARIKRVIIARKWPDLYWGAVAGWGETNEISHHIGSLLKAVKVKVGTKEECSVLGKLNPGAFCATSNEPKLNRPVHGDSGSALITDNYIQLGLVSHRSSANLEMLVYTNMTYNYYWILDTSKRLYCINHN